MGSGLWRLSSLTACHGWPAGPCYFMLSWSPNSTFLHLDFYLLSWRWWPLWSGGTLYQWSLQPEKASQHPCLFKISVSCTWRLSGWKNRDEKLSWTSGKACLFHACPRIPEMRDPSKLKFLKRGIPQNGNFQNEGSLKIEISKTRDCLRRWPTDGAACSCVKSDL